MTESKKHTWNLPAFDEESLRRARARQENLTKPPGSLGSLESVAIQVAGWQGTARPRSRPAAAIIFASDHPVTKHGVSAFPSEVTAAMVANFLAGGAAASVMCRHHGIPLHVVDVGVTRPPEVEVSAFYWRAPVADMPAGDIRVEDAMSEATLEAAMNAGGEAVDRLDAETRTVILGEMGIGNTTPSAAICAALLDRDPVELVGPGTGVTGAALENKVAVVRDALARAPSREPREVLRTLGGREIAAMVGAAGRALERGMIVLVDGFIATAAALVLVRMAPEARRGLLFAHCSKEPGHRLVLAALDARALLDLDLRLGEGSGALAALPLVDLACALHNGMATFAEAGVPGAREEPQE